MHIGIKRSGADCQCAACKTSTLLCSDAERLVDRIYNQIWDNSRLDIKTHYRDLIAHGVSTASGPNLELV